MCTLKHVVSFLDALEHVYSLGQKLGDRIDNTNLYSRIKHTGCHDEN